MFNVLKSLQRASHKSQITRKMGKTIFVLLDGAADSWKNGRTALQLAHKPNLDFMAGNGLVGTWTGAQAPKEYNIKSLSDIALMQALGYDFKDYPGRGFLEALGIGLTPKRGCVYLRGDFATVFDSRIIDRRAGREEAGLDELADAACMKIKGVKITVHRATGHRVVVVLDGPNLSPRISDADIGSGKVEKVHPLDTSSDAERTASIVNEFCELCYIMLDKHQVNNPTNKKRKQPANYILLRGAGEAREARSFYDKFGLRACTISGVAIMKGISRYAGIDSINVPEATGDLHTNLTAKLSATLKALERYDFVVLHINGADIASHSKDVKAKTAFIERIDREVLSELATLKNTNIVVTEDHRNLVKTGEHDFGSVPVLFNIAGREIKNSVGKFDEKSAEEGIHIDNIMETLINITH